MTERYQSRIEVFCQAEGIDIPSDFYRHSATRLAAIDLDSEPPKLIAKTWFRKEDVAYYLTHLSAGRQLRILDFKDRRELIFNGASSFAVGSEF